jgi:hypothetical protein
MNNLQKNQFIYTLLDNSFELLTELIKIPEDIHSETLHDTLFQFAQKIQFNDFEFDNEDGYFYITKFLNHDKLKKLQKMLENAHQQDLQQANEYYKAATEGERRYGD